MPRFRPRAKTPYGAVETDRSHPISILGGAFWLLNEGAGTPWNVLSVPRVSTFTGSPSWTTNRDGLAMKFDNSGAAQSVDIASEFGIVANGPFTLVARVRVPSTSEKGAALVVGQGTGGFAIGVGSGTVDNLGNELIALHEGIAWRPSGVNIGTGLHTIAYSCPPAGTTDAQFYLDGANVASIVNNASSGDPGNQTHIGGYAALGGAFPRYWNGDVVWAYVVPAVVPAGIHRALHDDPYAFVRPKRQSFRAPAGAVKFRKTLSPIGTRAGGRQRQVA